MTITFEIPGDPVPWARTEGGQTRNRFEPEKQRLYRQKAKLFAKAAMRGRRPLEGALVFGAVFIFSRPKSHYNRQGERKANVSDYKTSRPDLSNLVKLIEDALNGIVYRDDAQIVDYGYTKKVYGETPRAVITIRETD